jgi:hypothetical protein
MQGIQTSIASKNAFEISFPGFDRSFIVAKSHFIELNHVKQDEKPEDYKDNFNEIIEKAKQRPGQFIYVEPRTMNATNGQKSVTSFCVDIGFVKYDN